MSKSIQILKVGDKGTIRIWKNIEIYKISLVVVSDCQKGRSIAYRFTKDGPKIQGFIFGVTTMYYCQSPKRKCTKSRHSLHLLILLIIFCTFIEVSYFFIEIFVYPYFILSDLK